MSLTITKSNGQVLASVPDGVNVTNACSLTLIGRNSPFYALEHNQNFVHLLENSASGIAPSNPTRGQTWYDTVNQVLKLYDGTVWTGITTGGGGSSGGSGGGTGTTLSSEVFVSIDNARSCLAIVANGRVVMVVSHSVIANADLPVNLVVNSTNYAFQSRFPNGIQSGVTLATDSGGTVYKFNGIATQSQYADIAERFAADAVYSPGTLLALGGAAEVTATGEHASDAVFGVVTTNPAYLMNDVATDHSLNPGVALAGRIPCRVIGGVRKGQRLCSSAIAGVAQAADTGASWDVVFGRALEDRVDTSEGLVMVVVGAR